MTTRVEGAKSVAAEEPTVKSDHSSSGDASVDKMANDIRTTKLARACQSRTSSTAGTSPLDFVDNVKDFEKATGMKLPSTKDIFDSIPANCKRRCTLRSTVSLMRDIALLALMCFLWKKLNYRICGDSVLLNIISWTIYAFVQGTIATGVWVIGHECGHGAYSEWSFVNDLVGYAVHTPLLVPYYSWQFSHHKHHSYCNHMLWGESHVPATKKGYSYWNAAWRFLGEDAFAINQAVEHLLFGWPAYLIWNTTGGRMSWKGDRLNKKGVVDHFRASNSEVFPPDVAWKVTISGLGCFTVLALLGIWGAALGWTSPLKWYVGPYLIVNSWLVLYTWLQHTHPNIPHYGSGSFTWLRGCLSTIDRPYPWIIDELHHHIGTTHVLHHIDFKIPHYHAQEATEHVKKVLGPLYRVDTTSVYAATVDVCKFCHYVDSVDSVQYYRSREDLEAEYQKCKKAE